jgi:glycosyltransferase involved in cell wall biosynthesis
VSPAALWMHRPHVLHSSYLDFPWDGGRARRVVTVHDMIQELFPTHFPADDAVASRKAHAVRVADHVICVSQTTADDLKRLLGVSPNKVTVVYSGIGSGRRDVRSVLSVSSRPYLLYVGHRGGHKNFETALRAFASSRRLHEHFDLLAFGGSRFNAEEIMLIRSLGLREGVVRHTFGTDDALDAAYTAARAFVYPSLYEGFGHPPLEAMQAGCTVVCSTSGSIPEVVGDAGVYFDPTSVEAARTSMEAACFDEVLRAELAVRSAARIERFTWERCAERTRAVYHGLM